MADGLKGAIRISKNRRLAGHGFKGDTATSIIAKPANKGQITRIINAYQIVTCEVAKASNTITYLEVGNG